MEPSKGCLEVSKSLFCQGGNLTESCGQLLALIGQFLLLLRFHVFVLVVLHEEVRLTDGIVDGVFLVHDLF